MVLKRRGYRKRFMRRKRKGLYKPRIGTVLQSRSSGLPTNIIVPLRYTDFITTSTGAFGSYSHVYRLTSAYDPDQTGAGHQPLYFDQWSAMYKTYQINKSIFSFIIKSDVLGTCCTLIPSCDSFFVPSTIGQAMESTRKSVKYTASDKITSLRKTYYNNNLLGVPANSYWGMDDYKAVITADPSRNNFVTFTIQDIAGADVTFTAIVNIVLYVKFMDPKHVSQS